MTYSKKQTSLFFLSILLIILLFSTVYDWVVDPNLDLTTKTELMAILTDGKTNDSVLLGNVKYSDLLEDEKCELYTVYRHIDCCVSVSFLLNDGYGDLDMSLARMNEISKKTVKMQKLIKNLEEKKRELWRRENRPIAFFRFFKYLWGKLV